MPITGGALNVTPYRHVREVCFAFGGNDLAAATYLYDIADLPAGSRVVFASLLVEVAATGTGTNTLAVQTNEGTPTVLLGDTPVNGKAQGYVSSFTAAVSGGPTSAITARKKMPARQKIQLKSIVGAGDNTLSASGIITLGIVDEDLSA